MRYQQSFIIDVISAYYNLLSGYDQLKNAENNYNSAVNNTEYLRMLSEAGRVTDLDVDQALQWELEAEDGLLSARTSYMGLLDSFKIYLGIPVNLDAGPDQKELERIAEQGLLSPGLNPEEAISIALTERLDLHTAADQVSDSSRHVKIALRDFLPSLDAGYQYSISGDDDKDKIDFDFDRSDQVWSLNLGLPMDWTPRRNNYRMALIELEQAKREEAELKDSIIIEVREACRQLERLRRSYNIQQESVRLAERRVESVNMKLEVGRASARDLLEAQESLLLSKNALTSALVDYTIQRLDFWNAIERLKIDPKGMWYEDKGENE
jgi:outer membrane protein TolC